MWLINPGFNLISMLFWWSRAKVLVLLVWYKRLLFSDAPLPLMIFCFGELILMGLFVLISSIESFYISQVVCPKRNLT